MSDTLSPDVLSPEEALALAISVRKEILDGYSVHPINVERLCCAIIANGEGEKVIFPAQFIVWARQARQEILDGRSVHPFSVDLICDAIVTTCEKAGIQ